MIKITTSMGDICLTLDENSTPKTVANFRQYIQEEFYNNTLFHRVIPGFMIQGGGMDESFSSKKTKEPIENEAKTAKSNRRGTIAMARTNAPHSATAQFFINVVDNPFLDYKDENNQGYCVFGEVTSGMDIVDAIVKVKTGSKEGHQDVPVENVLTHSITEE